MNKRLLKQLIYGAFYLFLFFWIGYGFYVWLLKPAPTCFDNKLNQGEEEIDCGGPCIPCAIKKLSPIAVLKPPQLLVVEKNIGVLLLQFKNSNFNYAADRFSYTVDFYNLNGEKIHSLTNDSFIYAGRIKTIIEAPITFDLKEIARTEVKISNINWVPVEKFAAPNLQTRSIKVELLKDQAKVSGLVFNNNSFVLSQALVTVITYNRAGLEAGASKTLLKDLKPFEERAFTVFIPLAGQNINPDATMVLAEGLK